jgi:hypothetical protein
MDSGRSRTSPRSRLERKACRPRRTACITLAGNALHRGVRVLGVPSPALSVSSTRYRACSGSTRPLLTGVNQVARQFFGVLPLEPQHLSALLAALGIFREPADQHEECAWRIPPGGKPHGAASSGEDVYPVSHLPSFSPHLVGEKVQAASANQQPILVGLGSARRSELTVFGYSPVLVDSPGLRCRRYRTLDVRLCKAAFSASLCIPWLYRMPVGDSCNITGFDPHGQLGRTSTASVALRIRHFDATRRSTPDNRHGGRNVRELVQVLRLTNLQIVDDFTATRLHRCDSCGHRGGHQACWQAWWPALWTVILRVQRTGFEPLGRPV